MAQSLTTNARRRIHNDVIWKYPKFSSVKLLLMKTLNTRKIEIVSSSRNQSFRENCKSTESTQWKTSLTRCLMHSVSTGKIWESPPGIWPNFVTESAIYSFSVPTNQKKKKISRQIVRNWKKKISYDVRLRVFGILLHMMCRFLDKNDMHSFGFFYWKNITPN